MKKNILLIFTFIISFILLIDNVEAAKELTCWYGQSTSDGQAGLIVSQDSDGKRTFWAYPAGMSIQDAKKISSENVEENITEAFTECPRCLDISSAGKYNYDNNTECKDGYVELYNSYNKAWTQEDIKSRQILSADDLSEKQKENMKVCRYEKHSYDSYKMEVTFYIDSETWKLYSTIPKSHKTSNGIGQHLFTYKFTRYEFISKYKEDGCPNIYYYKQGPYGEDISLQFFYYLDYKKAGKGAKELELEEGSRLEIEEEKEPDVEINNCGDLFGPDLVEEINKVMNIIRIAVPILLIIFGIVDFFKATFDNNEDEMKKDRERFIKRIIAAIIVFLVPFFVNLVLDVANTVWSDINSDTCIDSTE